MKILTVVSNLNPGGNQRVAQNFSLMYKQCSHEVAVLAIKGGGVREEILKQSNIEVFIGGEECWHSAVEQAIAWKPNIVHIHSAGMIDDPIEKLREGIDNQVPFLEKQSFSNVSPHNHLIDLNIHQGIWCCWKFKRNANRIKIKPAPPSIIIPNPTDTNYFYQENQSSCQSFKKQLGIPENGFVYGRIGQPIEAKWDPTVVIAFSKIIKTGRNAYLLLIGAPTSIKNHIKNLPEFIKSRVFLIDFIHGDEALRIAYSAIDVFVHSARKGESFGMVLVESMLCKTPVITLATPYKDNSQVEVVGHEVGGLVVYGSQEFSSAMAELFDNRDYLLNLGNGGRKRALNLFSFEAVSQKLQIILKSLEQSNNRQEFVKFIINSPDLISNISNQEIIDLLKSMISIKKNNSLLREYYKIINLIILLFILLKTNPNIYNLEKMTKVFKTCLKGLYDSGYK